MQLVDEASATCSDTERNSGLSKKYSYAFDLQGNNAAAVLMRLVGARKRVLEVGCSCGSQSRVLQEHLGCEVTGIELDRDAAREAVGYCRQIIEGDIESLALEDHLREKTFDVVLFADVLEHLRDPVEALRKVKPYISDDGYLCASIPNIVHASVIMEMVRGEFEYRPEGLLDDTHIHFFTKHSLLQTFEAAGYLITDVHRVVRHPRVTEFRTTPMNSEETMILNYILSTSPESQTYQFVVRALKSSDLRRGHAAPTAAVQDHVRKLETRLAHAEKRVRELESAVAWMERNWLRRAKTLASRLLQPRAKD